MSMAEVYSHRRRDSCAVLFALAFPTLLTVVYFILLAGYSAGTQLAAFGIGKFVQFVFPALWVFGVQRARLVWARPIRSDVLWGGGLGLGLLAATLALYFPGLKPAGIFAGSVAEAVRQKAEGLEVDSPTRFLVMSVFYVIVHSLLEEYYWRWFVFGQLRRLTALSTAIAVSSVGFAAHHVCVISVYFGWFSATSILLSLAVAAGGAIWAWVYYRTGSLYGPWICHAFVDAAIFIVGYDLIVHFSPP
jgi:membrane protease YdiL (CAAX protease family)